VQRCGDCEFIFSSLGEDSSDPDLYEEDWAKTELNPTFVYANGTFTVRNERMLQEILDRIEPFREMNRLLDVGCSAAFFLKLAEVRGWDVTGVEVSDFGVRYSREVLGIDVRQGTLQDVNFPDNSFDVIFNSHVIEHISEPRVLVREMWRILRPGGALVTVVPTQFAAPRFRLFGQLSGEAPPRHVSFFTKRSFAKLLRLFNFNVIYLHQNIELMRLFKISRESGPPFDRAEQPAGGQVTAKSSPPRGLPMVRLIKTNLNIIGTGLGIGDELTAIAVKPEA
jgi:SAM-dependent methyltransferase